MEPEAVEAQSDKPNPTSATPTAIKTRGGQNQVRSGCIQFPVHALLEGQSSGALGDFCVFLGFVGVNHRTAGSVLESNRINGTKGARRQAVIC